MTLRLLASLAVLLVTPRVAHADELDRALAAGFPASLEISLSRFAPDGPCRAGGAQPPYREARVATVNRATIDRWYAQSAALAAPLDAAVADLVATLRRDRPWTVAAPKRPRARPCPDAWARYTFALGARRWAVDLDALTSDARFAPLHRWLAPPPHDPPTQGALAIVLASGLPAGAIAQLQVDRPELWKQSQAWLPGALADLARRAAADRADFSFLALAELLPPPTIDHLLGRLAQCQAPSCAWTFDEPSRLQFCEALAAPGLGSAARVLAIPGGPDFETRCAALLAEGAGAHALTVELGRIGTDRAVALATQVRSFARLSNAPAFTPDERKGMPDRMIASLPAIGLVGADLEAAILDARKRLALDTRALELARRPHDAKLLDRLRAASTAAGDPERADAFAARLRLAGGAVHRRLPGRPDGGLLIEVQADDDPAKEWIKQDGYLVTLLDPTAAGWSETFVAELPHAPRDEPDRATVHTVTRLSPRESVALVSVYKFAAEGAGTTTAALAVLDTATKKLVRTFELVLMEQPGDMCDPCGPALTASPHFADLDADGTKELVLHEIDAAHFFANPAGRNPPRGPQRVLAWRWTRGNWELVPAADASRLLAQRSARLAADSARATGPARRALLAEARALAPNDPELVLEVLASSPDTQHTLYAQTYYDLVGAARFQERLDADARLAPWKLARCKDPPADWEDLWGYRTEPVLRCPAARP